MDDDGAVVGHRIHARDRLVHAVDHQVHGRVAVGVDDDRNASPDEFGGGRLVLAGDHDAVGHVVRWGSRGSLLVRDRDPCRAALRGAVEHQLHPADPEAALVVARVAYARQVRGRLVEAREGRDVRLEGLAVRGRLKRLGLRRAGPAVLDGGRAVAQVDVDRPANEVVELLARRGGATIECEQSAGGFLQHPVGLHRAVHAPHMAAGRIGGVGGDVAGRKRGGVGRGQVPRHVGEDDGMFGRRAVEILARGVAALLEQRVVVAAPGHHLAGRDVVLVDPRTDLAHDVVDVVDVAHRRRVQPQRRLVAPRAQEVAVRVDEPRQEGVVPQVDHPGRWPVKSHHLVHRSCRHDGLAAHRDRRHGGLLRIHGDDVVAVEDGVRGIGLRSTTRDHNGKGHGENGEGVIEPAHDSLQACLRLTRAPYSGPSCRVKPKPTAGTGLALPAAAARTYLLHTDARERRTPRGCTWQRER